MSNDIRWYGLAKGGIENTCVSKMKSVLCKHAMQYSLAHMHVRVMYGDKYTVDKDTMAFLL
jgi:hypothetical protein